MEEYTNPSGDYLDAYEIEEDDGLFDDVTEDEDEPGEVEEPTSDEAEEGDGKEGEEEPDDKPAQTLRVKYNGVEREITVEEAITLAQKGMNYDKVAEERDRLRGHEKATRVMENFAKLNNMSLDEYADFLETQQKTVSIQREMQDIQSKHPDVPDDLAREIAELRAETKRKEMEAQEAARRKEEEAAAQKPWLDFIREYPSMKDIKDLPEDVLEGIKSGLTPTEAMLRHERKEKEKEIEELRKRLETQEKNKANKKKAVGSAASNAAGKSSEPFLEGFGV